jgi:hypothetical protein
MFLNSKWCTADLPSFPRSACASRTYFPILQDFGSIPQLVSREPFVEFRSIPCEPGFKHPNPSISTFPTLFSDYFIYFILRKLIKIISTQWFSWSITQLCRRLVVAFQMSYIEYRMQASLVYRLRDLISELFQRNLHTSLVAFLLCVISMPNWLPCLPRPISPTPVRFV